MKRGDKVAIEFEMLEVQGTLLHLQVGQGKKKGFGFSELAVVDCGGDVLTVPRCCIYKVED